MPRGQFLDEARQKRMKHRLVFSSDAYSIKEIPLNLKILIKLPKKEKFHSVDRDYYTPIEEGIEFAHETAKKIIEELFEP